MKSKGLVIGLGALLVAAVLAFVFWPDMKFSRFKQALNEEIVPYIEKTYSAGLGQKVTVKHDEPVEDGNSYKVANWVIATEDQKEMVITLEMLTLADATVDVTSGRLEGDLIADKAVVTTPDLKMTLDKKALYDFVWLDNKTEVARAEFLGLKIFLPGDEEEMFVLNGEGKNIKASLDEDDLSQSMETLRLYNEEVEVTFDDTFFEGNGTFGAYPAGMRGQAKMKIAKIALRGKGEWAVWGTLDINDLVYNLKADDQGMTLDEDFNAVLDCSKNDMALAMLGEYGLDEKYARLDMNFNFEAKVGGDDGKGLVKSKFSIKDLGEVNFGIGAADIPADFMNASNDDEVGKSLIKASLGQVSLRYKDMGLYELGLNIAAQDAGMSVDDLRKELLANLPDKETMPGAAEALKSFIEDPDELCFTASTKDKLTFEQLMEMIDKDQTMMLMFMLDYKVTGCKSGMEMW